MEKSRRNFLRRSAIGTTGIVVGVNSLKAEGSKQVLENNSQTPGMVNSPYLVNNSAQPEHWIVKPVRGGGPATSYEPVIEAAIVRRKEDYGMFWPGAVYDGKAAIARYTEQIKNTAKLLGMKLNLRTDPVYSNDEADSWIATVKGKNPDGIVLLVLDRQQHSWPTAYKVADTDIPSVIFAPLGCAFHSNTAPLGDKPGCVVYSTTLEDSGQLQFGMKMLEAGAKMRHSRAIAFRGNEQGESSMGDLGIKVITFPLQAYIDEVNNIPDNSDVMSMTENLMRCATQQIGATREDVINGVKGYFAARRILEREKGDSITLAGCVDLVKYRPCIAWATLCDEGIPAVCEGDLGALAANTVVQYLFSRPGFMQDPVPDTAHQAFIGAHCVCATRLNGFDQPREPFKLSHHHGNTDATVVTKWKEGQRVTAIDVANRKGEQTEISLLTGRVMDNLSVPPNGGCVVSVRYQIDGINNKNVLTVPGMHQVFFYGDYEREIEDFCKLFNFKLKKFNLNI
jgi:hypothetical protein